MRSAPSLPVLVAILVGLGVACGHEAGAPRAPRQEVRAQRALPASTHVATTTVRLASAPHEAPDAPGQTPPAASDAPVVKPVEDPVEEPAEETIELPLADGLPVVVFAPAGRGPQPLLVATHGAGGRATTHCALWRRIVGPRGFIVCPRGKAMYPYLPGSHEAYYYDGHPALDREVAAAIDAVVAHYGERLDVAAPIFAGYSQGASMGALILPGHAGRFARAVLVEGGVGQHQEWNVAVAKRFAASGGERVLFACGRLKCFEHARRSAHYLRLGGLEARVVHAEGAGHTYRDPVETMLRDAFAWLSEGDARWSTR